MRITNNMMIANMITNLGNNQTRLSAYQNQLDTGKKIQVPSDDPVVAARALKLRTDVSQVEQYQKNIKDAGSWLDATDEALSKMGDVLKRARELSVQASNGTNTPEETQKIGLEIKQLKAQIIHLSNSTYAGRYIFSGFKTDQKLINDDETSPDYGKFSVNVETNKERIFYEIGVGDSINVNVAGGDLFNDGTDANNPGYGISTSKINTLSYPYTVGASNAVNISVDGTNVAVNIAAGTYATSADLAKAVKDAVTPVVPVDVSITGNQLEIRTTSKTATSEVKLAMPLSSFFVSVGVSDPVESTGAGGETPSMIKLFNDVIAHMDAGEYKEISDELDTFDKETNNLLRVRADVGARQNRVDLTDDRMSNDLINYTDLMSKNEDVDVAETIMNLKNEENVYKASLAGGARIIQQTLVDFLR
jgi:flagellar hook-associated protein 3 FlgL